MTINIGHLASHVDADDSRGLNFPTAGASRKGRGVRRTAALDGRRRLAQLRGHCLGIGLGADERVAREPCPRQRRLPLHEAGPERICTVVRQRVGVLEHPVGK